jgi:hypothetical protein
MSGLEITRGLAVRLTVAVLVAVAGGIWLWRASRREEHPRGRMGSFLLAALSVFWPAAWLVLALVRIRYPFELEWLGGTVRDSTERVLAGQPLYATPTADWIPFEYTPLYYWVSAGVRRVTGLPGFVSLRAVSILSTLASAWLIYNWVKRLGGTKLWALAAVGIFFAAYRMTGAWYDLERVDMLALFLSLLGAWWSQRALEAEGRKSWLLGCGAGFTFVLAFLTKQQSLLFLLAALAALGWRRRWAPAAALLTTSLILGGAAIWGLQSATDGWFGYYCFSIPARSTMQLSLARNFFIADLPLYAPCLAILASSLLLRRRIADEPAPFTVMGTVTAAAILSSLLSRAHWGGDQNVLIPAFTLLAAAACSSAAHMERPPDSASLRLPLTYILVAQILVLTYRPDAQLPTAVHRQAGERFAATIKELEKEGEVLCLGHGAFTTTRHAHFFGLMNVTNAEGRLPAAVSEALRTLRFAAIVLDEPPPTSGVLAEGLSGYPQAECLDFTTSWVVTGYPTPGPDRRVWVLRPR